MGGPVDFLADDDPDLLLNNVGYPVHNQDADDGQHRDHAGEERQPVIAPAFQRINPAIRLLRLLLNAAQGGILRIQTGAHELGDDEDSGILLDGALRVGSDQIYDTLFSHLIPVRFQLDS